MVIRQEIVGAERKKGILICSRQYGNPNKAIGHNKGQKMKIEWTRNYRSGVKQKQGMRIPTIVNNQVYHAMSLLCVGLPYLGGAIILLVTWCNLLICQGHD